MFIDIFFRNKNTVNFFKNRSNFIDIFIVIYILNHAQHAQWTLNKIGKTRLNVIEMTS